MTPSRIENEAGKAPVVLVVDHASNAIPERWGTLGLDDAAREAHIAWDPGALPVARVMSRLLDAPLIHATVSRLVLDLNRPLSSSTLIPSISETTEIPGNRNLSPDDRALRVASVYEPYHAAVDDLVERQAARCSKAGHPTIAVVAIHTFTPVYRGVARDLQLGVLFDRDERLGRAMLDALSADSQIRVAANQPYSPADEVYWTLDRHAASRGHMNVMIEIRNDEVRTEEAQRRWAERLAVPIARIMGTAT